MIYYGSLKFLYNFQNLLKFHELLNEAYLKILVNKSLKSHIIPLEHACKF